MVKGERLGDDFATEIDVGDINGDGIGDLVVTAPRADSNGQRSGRVYVFFGSE